MKSSIDPTRAIDKQVRENYIQTITCKTGVIERDELMKEQILADLTAKNDRVAWALTEKIVSESQETDQWYDCFDDFASLLSHPKALVRNRGFSLLAANVQWDDENRFDAHIAEFLSHITDEKPISARQCIQALAQIGQAKPRYIPLILTALHNADLSKYKDSMRPLIEKDMAEVERLLTGSG
ncbi:MAG: SufBD protein [Candidatus Limivicinus sp.]